MKKTAKTWYITAAALVLMGCILFIGVMSSVGWDVSRLSAVSFETRIHEIAEPFRDLSLTTDTANIVFARSEDGRCRVACYEEANATHSVTVENGVLLIQRIDQRSWYDHIGFRFSSPRITVYLPQAEYGALSVCESTGDIHLPKGLSFGRMDLSASTGSIRCSAAVREAVRLKTGTGDLCLADASAGSLDLSVTTGQIKVSDVRCAGDIPVSVSTGKAYLTRITCKNLISSGTTGDIFLEDTAAAEAFSLERSTGNVRFDRADASEIFVRTGTGNVTGSLLTDKVFLTQTDTGTVEVPQTITGGRCEIRTDTGDIELKID